MTSAALSGRFSDYGLAWALALSVVLHAAIVAFMQPFHFDPPPQQIALEIELQQPQPEPPPPPPPAAGKPKELPKPQPVQPRKPQPEPPPIRTPEPAPAPQAETPPPPPPPAVIAATPKPEEPPVFTAPPEPPKPVGPTPQDIDAARNHYGNLLAREFAKHKQYPRVAQMRGWQGTVRVQLELDAAGKVISTSISESSGHEVLDQQAIEMVKKAIPLPLPPEILRNKPLTIFVPVPFKLE
ncbi:MAG TPA: energy transducer TonB [Methylophilaceae bacterium]|nr:energy transducer TonB [Methylophilaceae bacterium]